MGTTPTHGLPYPENTDLVTNGAAAIQQLAEGVDAKLPLPDEYACRMVRGTYSGDGTSGRLIDLPFDPDWVVITINDLSAPSGYYYFLGPIAGDLGGWGIQLQPNTGTGYASMDGKCVSGGFLVGDVDGNPSNGNMSGTLYEFVAFSSAAGRLGAS